MGNYAWNTLYSEILRPKSRARRCRPGSLGPAQSGSTSEFGYGPLKFPNYAHSVVNITPPKPRWIRVLLSRLYFRSNFRLSIRNLQSIRTMVSQIVSSSNTVVTKTPHCTESMKWLECCGKLKPKKINNYLIHQHVRALR